MQLWDHTPAEARSGAWSTSDDLMSFVICHGRLFDLRTSSRGRRSGASCSSDRRASSFHSRVELTNGALIVGACSREVWRTSCPRRFERDSRDCVDRSLLQHHRRARTDAASVLQCDPHPEVLVAAALIRVPHLGSTWTAGAETTAAFPRRGAKIPKEVRVSAVLSDEEFTKSSDTVHEQIRYP